MDRNYQRRDFASTAQWLSCIGFSFSVPYNQMIAFDERFEGWGPEDRELALRLVMRHGYSVRYHDEIEVYHLEAYSTGRKTITARTEGKMLPTEHDKIVTFFKNMFYFSRQYPQVDLSSLTATLLLYHLDSSTNRWSYQPFKINRSDPSYLRLVTNKKKIVIENWLKAESALT
jgi:N-terminal domain of galactosyltransferase